MLQTLHPKALLVRVGRVRHPIGVEQEKEEFAPLWRIRVR